MLIRDLIANCAAAYPGKVALIDGPRRRTFSELHRRSDQFARALQILGIAPGQSVGILTPERVEVYEHLYACYKIGAVRVGLNTRYARREMLHVIRDSAMRVLLIHRDCLDLLADDLPALAGEGLQLIGYGGSHSLPLDYEALLAEASHAPDLPPLGEESLCALSYTSGTTGLPKGVELSQRAMREAIVHTVVNIGLRHDDIWFASPSSAWITFLLASMQLANGMTVVIPEGAFSPELALAMMAEHRVTSTILVPVMLQRMLAIHNADKYDLSSLRLITYGSSPARPSLIRALLDTFDCELMQLYGLTESAGGWVTFLQHADHLRGLAGEPEILGSCGQPGPHMRITIRDSEGAILPTGETGEVWLQSDTTMLGYHNLPELTAGVLRDGWLCTHDLGHLDSEGRLYLTDRKNYLIITGAANVYPSTVEAVISEHPQVAEVAVVGVPHPEWGEAVVAVVIPRSVDSGQDELVAELLAFCHERLAGYEVPKFIELRAELPRGLTGKVLKGELQRSYIDRPDLLPWPLPRD